VDADWSQSPQVENFHNLAQLIAQIETYEHGADAFAEGCFAGVGGDTCETTGGESTLATLGHVASDASVV
jgi:hypothetical protein